MATLLLSASPSSPWGSQGVGLHDPDDPNPGTPILNEVAVSTIVNQWQDAVGEHEVIDLTVIDNSTINIGK